MTIVRNNTFYPDIFVDAVRGAFRGHAALHGTGAVTMNPSLPDGLKGGDKIKVPYFGTLGELQVTTEDIPVPLSSVSQSVDEAVVRRAGRAFEMSKWKMIAESSSDPYGEFARQLTELVGRAWDGALIDAAASPTGLPASHVIDRFNASSPVNLQYGHVIDGRAVFGDEQGQIGMLCMHSKPYFDLMKQLDAENRPLLTSPNDGGLVRIAGVPVMPSDRCPIDFSASGAISSAGTAPPSLTISGSTNLGINHLEIAIASAGALGAATFRYSFDGGATWSNPAPTAASASLVIDNDASRPTGLVAHFSAGSYSADNEYTATPRYSSLIVKPGALALWYNASPAVDTDKDILKDNVVAAIHTYFVPHRYARIINESRPGVVVLKHN
ncbi:MAG: hypothetical protein U0269_13665 [Polyangiales bacterium]